MPENMKIHHLMIVSLLTSGLAFSETQAGNGDSATNKGVDKAIGMGADVLGRKNLLQHWVHSREEQDGPGGRIQIFRPAGSREFPLSRFRMAYKFAPKGQCEWMFLDPADRHHFKQGLWEIDTLEKKTVLRITMNGKIHSFRIARLTKDELRLAPLKLNP